MTQYPAYELSGSFSQGLVWEMKPTTGQEQLKSGSVSGSVSDVHNPGEYLSLPIFLSLESKHNSALLHLSEEQGESALGSANRRNSSTESTAVTPGVCICLLAPSCSVHREPSPMSF